MDYSNRRAASVIWEPVSKSKKDLQRSKKWTTTDWSNVKEFQYHLWNSEVKFRIGHKHHKSKDPSCLVWMCQACSGDAIIILLFHYYSLHYSPDTPASWAVNSGGKVVIPAIRSLVVWSSALAVFNVFLRKKPNSNLFLMLHLKCVNVCEWFSLLMSGWHPTKVVTAMRVWMQICN